MREEFSAYAKKKKQRNIFRLFLILLMAGVILGIGTYFLTTKFFVAKDVLVQGTDLYDKEAILEVVSVKEGTPLVKLSKKNIAANVEKNFPYLVDVEVDFALPGTVNVTFREEFGVLAVKLGVELFAVDRDLNILAKETAENDIPRINLVTQDVSRCVVGEKLTFFESGLAKELKSVLKSLEEAEMLESVELVDISDKFNMKVHYLGRFELLIGESSDLKQKFAMVKEVIRDLGPEEKGRIDITDPNTAYVKLSNQIGLQ